jgi:hypothetical protein
MLLYLFDGQPLVGIANQDQLDEVLALCGDFGVLGYPVVHTHDPIQDLLEGVLVALIFRPLEGVLAE